MPITQAARDAKAAKLRQRVLDAAPGLTDEAEITRRAALLRKAEMARLSKLAVQARHLHFLPHLRDRRLAAGLKQSELADLAGCKQSFLSRLERQERAASLPFIERLAGALNKQPADLIGSPP